MIEILSHSFRQLIFVSGVQPFFGIRTYASGKPSGRQSRRTTYPLGEPFAHAAMKQWSRGAASPCGR